MENGFSETSKHSSNIQVSTSQTTVNPSVLHFDNPLPHCKQSLHRPGQSLRVPGCWGSQFPRQSTHEGGKVVSPMYWSLYHPERYTWPSFVSQAEMAQGHCAAGRIMSMKTSNDPIKIRIRDLPACSAVPQPTAPPRAPGRVFIGRDIPWQLLCLGTRYKGQFEKGILRAAWVSCTINKLWQKSEAHKHI